jgi:hypothetical protein
MKKILFILGLVILFTSCDSCLESRQSEKLEMIYIQGVGRITYVEFDNHQYVRYENGYQGSICHSPNCPYLNKIENKYIISTTNDVGYYKAKNDELVAKQQILLADMDGLKVANEDLYKRLKSLEIKNAEQALRIEGLINK